MAHRITGVARNSPAARAGIEVGDELIAIDGEIIIDFIDYQALSANADLEVQTRRGMWRVKKEEYADLGLSFETPMMSGVRQCANNCAFCFVDQLPRGARRSLCVKDDDWRMSLLMGNYVSLTNVPDRELERIIRRRVSPLYISVHAMDPAVRVEMMGTPRAAKLPEQLARLKAGGIEFHAQAVLCPGMNDGQVLARTIEELTALFPAARSLALVPVGLTRHRTGLSNLRKFTKSEAAAVIDLADEWRKRLSPKLGTRFVFPSDELYLAAERTMPADEEYEDYAQIEDGVGMLRLFETEFAEAHRDMGEVRPARNARIAIACGVSAAAFFDALLRAYPVPGAQIRVQPIINRFFGDTVTVSGLITGGDLVAGMAGVECSHVLITQNMLRCEDNLFLDDMTLDEVTQRLARPVIPVGRQGGDLIRAIIDIVEESYG
jgi:putative radical SAM enzyme (TIGR03279 family)